MLLVPPLALGQEISFGKEAQHVFVELKISKDGDVHVQHKIKPSDSPVEVKTIPGTVSNIKVFNEEEKDVQHAVSGDNNSVVIFRSKQPVFIEYDLKDVLTLKDKVWTWDFRYLESTNFIFPEEVDLVFADNRPVLIGDQRGIKCHGCEMTLEYVIDEPTIEKNVKIGQQEFLVIIRTLGEIETFEFNHPEKTVSFDVTEPNRFVTVILPLDLLGNPYEVFLEDEKIMDHEYIKNDTHIWLNVKPNSTGTLEISGATAAEIPEDVFDISLLYIVVPVVVGGVIAAFFLLKRANRH